MHNSCKHTIVTKLSHARLSVKFQPFLNWYYILLMDEWVWECQKLHETKDNI